MKQARYFPGSTINAQPQAAHNPAPSMYTRKVTYGKTGNAVGGSTYVPSFGSGAQNRGGGVGGAYLLYDFVIPSVVVSFAAVVWARHATREGALRVETSS